jgi:hypothetical protein
LLQNDQIGISYVSSSAISTEQALKLDDRHTLVPSKSLDLFTRRQSAHTRTQSSNFTTHANAKSVRGIAKSTNFLKC